MMYVVWIGSRARPGLSLLLQLNDLTITFASLKGELFGGGSTLAKAAPHLTTGAPERGDGE